MSRNVGLSVLLFAAALIALWPAPAVAEDDVGFKSIFDGKTLIGWDGDPQHWHVEDGAITGEATKAQALKANTFIIWRQGEVDDFELKAEFKMAGGNSGIQYRSFEEPKAGRWVVGGYQADMDADDQWTGGLYGERYRGVLAAPGQKTIIGENHEPKVVGQLADRAALNSIIRKGDWNEYHIVARGNHLLQELNGRLVTDVTDEDTAMRRRGGIVALQLHAGFDMKVQFRNIRLKRLPMQDCKKVVFIAGPPSHDYAAHEYYAGCTLLAKALNNNLPSVYATVYRNGWPADPTAFDNANAIVVYADGDDGNLLLSHHDELDALARKGVGLGCLHYSLKVPKGKAGDAMLAWIGGYFETLWSVSPFWTARFERFPEHPITRGVKPFAVEDEWYYHMRFAKDMAGVTPILTAVPPDETRRGPDGARSGDAAVRERLGSPEVVAWAYDRAAAGGAGRGFGFTGGHVHWNWANDNYRKVVLNAVVWIAGAEVPREGVSSKTPTLEDLQANQDKPQPKGFDLDAVRKRLQSWGQTPATAPR